MAGYVLDAVLGMHCRFADCNNQGLLIMHVMTALAFAAVVTSKLR